MARLQVSYAALTAVVFVAIMFCNQRVVAENSNQIVVHFKDGQVPSQSDIRIVQNALNVRYVADATEGWSVFSAPDASSATAAVAGATAAFTDSTRTGIFGGRLFSTLVDAVSESGMYQAEFVTEECPVPNGALPHCFDMPGMDFIRAPEAWNRLSDKTFTTPSQAMIISSGVYLSHNNLRANLNTGASTTIVTGTGTVTPRTGGDDTVFGLGTHVAGIIGGLSDNNDNRDVQLSGVNPTARMISCRACDDAGACSLASIDACIQQALARPDVAVIYIPFALAPGVPTDAVTDAAIDSACNAGRVVVVPAGEVTPPGGPAAPTGADVNAPTAAVFPAAYAATKTCVLAVAATAAPTRTTGSTIPLRQDSNFGAAVKIAAPGTNIPSDLPPAAAQRILGPPPTGVAQNNARWSWGQLSGTNQAGAFVAGAAMLLKDAFPTATNLQIINCLVSSATREVLPAPECVAAAPPPPACATATLGGGVLDVNASLTCMEGLFPGTLPPPGVSPSPRPPSSFRCTDVTVNPDAATCNSATVAPEQLYSGGAGLTVTLSNNGPYPTGPTRVTVTPSDGTPACTSTVTVRSAANVTASSTKCFYPAVPGGSQLCIPVSQIASAVSNCEGSTISLSATSCSVTRPAGASCTPNINQVCIPQATLSQARLGSVFATVGITATSAVGAGGQTVPTTGTAVIQVYGRTVNPNRLAFRGCVAV